MCSDPKQMDETCTSTTVQVDVPLPQNNEKDCRMRHLSKTYEKKKRVSSQHQPEGSRSRFQGVKSSSSDKQLQIQLRCISNLEILTREISDLPITLYSKRRSYLRAIKHHRIYQRLQIPPL